MVMLPLQSDTPKTDAIARYVIHDQEFSEFKTNIDELVPADFARQLETKLNVLLKAAKVGHYEKVNGNCHCILCDTIRLLEI